MPGQRQADTEARPTSRGGKHLDLTVVSLDHPTADRKTQTNALIRAGRGGASACERLENPIQLSLADPGPLVLDQGRGAQLTLSAGCLIVYLDSRSLSSHLKYLLLSTVT